MDTQGIGYIMHIVRPGETLFSIARLYGTDLSRVIAANPYINAQNLQGGERIVVPVGSVVPTDTGYTHAVLTRNIDALNIIYPFLHVGSIGTSVLGRRLWMLRLGTGKRKVFYNAAFHANEWITAPLLMKYVENFCMAYVTGGRIYGYDVKELFDNATVYIVPMVNPDGVDLVTGALSEGSDGYERAKAISASFPAISFPNGWKANINGVDTNLQFPAGWEQAKEIKAAQGFDRPAPRDWPGDAPLSAPESRAVYELTRSHNFLLTLSYHTQGRVIYWRFLDYLPENSYEIGRRFAASSGYLLEETPYGSGFAGYKDWFIQDYNRPGYTIEVGIGANPLPISQFDTIYKENEGILTLGMVLA